MTRCKFKCESITTGEAWSSVKLTPVTHGSTENETFFKYTPGGEIRLDIVKPEVASQFVPGREYYIDISPAE